MLIGLNGKKRSGKDTVYERLVKRLPGATIERRAFADLMYESAAASLGVGVSWLRELVDDPDAKLVIHSPGVIVPMTFRRFVQRFGTEGHRDVPAIGEDFWVDRLDLSHERRIVVVTDVRMENEAQAVQDAGGTVVRVLGPEDVEDSRDGHLTEAGLPHRLVDYVLDNTTRGDSFEALDRNALDLVLRLLREERDGRVRFTT